MLISKQQISLMSLAALFLFAAIAIFAVFAFSATAALLYGPVLLTAFIVLLFLGMVCVAWLLRGLLRPYSQLVGEAKRAPVPHSGRSRNEAAFVLETFQSVVAQLQEQQHELERLSAQATKRADSAEQFSARIVASMPTGLIAFDPTGHVTLMNGPAQALFAGQGDSRALHFRSLFADLPALAGMVESCLTNGRLYRREEIDTVNGLADAKRIGATIAPIDPSESGSRGALCLLTDITEVTRLREQVALKRNLESLGEMSAGLAHEFKNSMAALHGYAQFLQSVDHDERSKAAANALVQEVRTLSDMITAFLNFARPRALQLEDISLDEMIQDCMRELQPSFERHRVAARFEQGAAQTARFHTRADPRLLHQALVNLLRNAAEAIADDQTDRRVIVVISGDTGEERSWAVVEICDTGPGIPKANLQKIFIPFFTTKSTGHGIGLALAHRVITQHGGALVAGNAPEGGAIFTIRLPVVAS